MSTNQVESTSKEILGQSKTDHQSSQQTQMQLDVFKIVEDITSYEPHLSVEQLMHLRHMLSVSKSINPEILINHNIIHFLSQFLDHKDQNIIIDALWCLSNITALQKEYAKAVAYSDAFPKIIILVDSSNNYIIDHALLCLANISGYSKELRKLCIEQGVGQKAVLILETHMSPHECIYVNMPKPSGDISSNQKIAQKKNQICPILCQAAFLIRNILINNTKNNTSENDYALLPICKALTQIDLKNENEHEIANYLIEALNYIEACRPNVAQLICDNNLVSKIVQIAEMKLSTSFVAFGVISDIATCDNSLTKQVFQAGVISLIKQLLDETNPVDIGSDPEIQSTFFKRRISVGDIRREVLFITSNICALGNEEVNVILNSGIAQRICDIIFLCQILSKGISDAVWAINNICSDQSCNIEI
ncbi:MAG: hypothetical protein EZS28_010501 [Streblomastix strix]|uniref:Importin subunit alpha n=1 Tax=Streblomastix strix TaxID=222440 RepID=A0A5J4WG47_9EUKA|nr:MAG: hypothetical protein EZS28_010501 [Streblomastix strix]